MRSLPPVTASSFPYSPSSQRQSSPAAANALLKATRWPSRSRNGVCDTPARKKKHKAVTSVLIHGIKPYVEKKDEEYMSKKMLEHFRTILNAWKQELLDEASRTVHTKQD